MENKDTDQAHSKKKKEGRKDTGRKSGKEEERKEGREKKEIKNVLFSSRFLTLIITQIPTM